MTVRAALLALVSLAMAGCYSGSSPAADPDEPGGGSSTGGEDGSSEESGEPVDEACALELPVATPLRRLTRAQYDNAVADLTGVDLQLAEDFPDDLQIGPFDSNVDGPVSELGVEMYLDAAEDLAAATSIDALVPCALPPDDPDACARAFVETWGRRVYRRPLTTDEVETLLALYDEGAQDGFEDGIRMVLRTALQSPDFLYVLELGEGDDSPRPLTGYEMASRLSFFLWNTIPDDALLDATAAGELESAESIEQRVQAMLDDPRAADALADFHGQWFGTRDLEEMEKDPELYPEFDEALATSMKAEVDAFVTDVILDGDARLATLFGGAHEGQDPDQRRGILTLPAVLAAHATVVTRGAFVRNVVLCQDVPPPPANVNTGLGDAEPGESPRDHWEAHLTDPSCAGCHLLIDPPGWAFDYYDGIGAWREAHDGFDVDATGELTATSVTGTFDGPSELIDLLLQTDELHNCTTTNWWRYSTGREFDESESCLQESLNAAFTESDGDIRALLTAIATSDAFRHAPN